MTGAVTAVRIRAVRAVRARWPRRWVERLAVAGVVVGHGLVVDRPAQVRLAWSLR